MKFSIITPSLNQAPYLKACLASVRRQSSQVTLEHWVIDGGSTDGTVEILADSSGVNWISEPDGGQSAAINKGLARATGDILAYLCADDFYEPGVLARVAAEFASHPETDVVFGDYFFLEGDSGWKRLKKTGGFSVERLRAGNFIGQPAVFWRRRVFEQFGGFDETLNYCMDFEYWLRIAGKTVWRHVPEPLAVARLHTGAKTSAQLVGMWEESARMGARYGIEKNLGRQAAWMRCGGQWYYYAKRRFFSWLGKFAGLGGPEGVADSRPVLAVWELHHLGDAVNSLPFLRGAMEQYRVVVVCRPGVAGFYRRALPSLDVLEWEPFWMRGGDWMGLTHVMRRLWWFRPQVAVSVWPDPRVHNMMQWSGASVRAGFSVRPENSYVTQGRGRFFKLWAGQWLARLVDVLGGHPALTQALDKHHSYQPHVQGWKQLAEKLNIPWRVEVPWLKVRNIQEGSVAAFFEQAAKKGRKVAVVHAGAGSPEKRWPVEYFQQVGRDWLQPHGFEVLWIDEGAGWVPEGEARAVTTDMSDLSAVLARADLVLANDSFPAHLAAALGRPVLTVFTSSDPRWFAPYGNEARVVRKDVCPFHPCLGRCLQPSYLCRDAIGPGDVMGKLELILGKPEIGGAS